MDLRDEFEKKKEEVRKEKPYLSEKKIQAEALDRLVAQHAEEATDLLKKKAGEKGWEVWAIMPPAGMDIAIALSIEKGKWTFKFGVLGGIYELVTTALFADASLEQATDYIIEHEYGHQRLAPAKIPFAPIGTYESIVGSIVEDDYIDRFLLKGRSKEIMERIVKRLKEEFKKVPPRPDIRLIQTTLRVFTLSEVKRYWKGYKAIIDAKEVLEGMRKVGDLKPAYEKLLKLLWRYRK